MRVTLKQVADATNLSITIVSQVLNDRPCRVSKENRKLILDTAEKLNYRPNLVAVSLVKGSTDTIGLAVSDIRNAFFSSLAKGVEDECQKYNWNVILCNSNDKHSKDMQNLRMLADKGVSGIILGMASESTAEMVQECIDFMNHERIPYILVDRYIETKQAGIVCVDHVLGGYQAVNYLLKLGHRNIACITGPSNLIDSQQRLEGYIKALDEFEIPYNPDLVVEGKYTFESGEQAIDVLFRKGLHVDAVFFFNDMMAIGAMKWLQAQGIRIPEDLSIIGYDDIFVDEFLSVPLTTIKQPTEQLGRVAARKIINKEVGNENQEERIIFETELIERKSVMDRN
ncbi:MAG: LacI family DNA-binding transcriptional regulator [Lachnospiraceae bacterium]|nr:LacI family DNA-binding transcriptional regulator [Lachnospiraceae bacterium]